MFFVFLIPSRLTCPVRLKFYRMKTMYTSSCLVTFKPPSLLSLPCVHYSPSVHPYPKTRICSSRSSHNSSYGLRFPVSAAFASVIHFEDFVEKDWSFLDSEDTNADGEHMHKIDRIISAGTIKETSKVLVSIGSEAFVDKLVLSTPLEELLVVHDSLLILACLKEKYDKIKCWQGELINVPKKWTTFDVVFLYYLPALPFELDQVLAFLATRCSPGAIVVISHPQGRQVVEEQKHQFPDVVVSSLPEKTELLLTTTADHSYDVVEFTDEPGFYLAVLRLSSRGK